METLSFILGMCSVVVAGIIAVTVYALVKIKKDIEHLKNNVNVAYSDIAGLTSDQRENKEYLQHCIEDMYRTMDSRLDKIIHRIKTMEENTHLSQ